MLIHGAGSDHLCWPPEIRRMAGEHILALDLPGHGRSGGVCEQSVQGYAAQVLSFLDKANIYRVALVGHSLGGGIALSLALSHPDRIAAIALLACGAVFNLPPDLPENLSSQASFSAAMEYFQSRLFGSGANRSLVEKVMRSLRTVRPSLLQSDWQAALSFDLRQQVELELVQPPVLVAVGMEDRITPPQMAHYLVKKIPHAQLLKVQDAGHMLMLEQPRRVGMELEGFFKALPLNLHEKGEG